MKYKYKNIEIKIIEFSGLDMVLTSNFDVSNPFDPGVVDPYLY